MNFRIILIKNIRFFRLSIISHNDHLKIVDFQVKSNGQTGDSHSSSSSINSLMSDAPIHQTTRNPISEWSDSNNMIVDQSKVQNITKIIIV